MAWLEPVTLRSARVTLEPLEHRHCADLIEAVKDGELWTLWYTFVPRPDKMSAEIDRRLGLQAAGAMLPFAVIDNATAKAVGMTTYMDADAVNRRLEIGFTWYRKRVQRTNLNTQCKLLLLTQGDRTAGGEARRHPAQPPPHAERNGARHLRLQHHRERVADREGASCVGAGAAAPSVISLTTTEGFGLSGNRSNAPE